jgi:phage tail protein X
MRSRRWGHALLQRSRVLAIAALVIAAGLLGFNLRHGAPLATGDVNQATTRLQDQTSVEVDSLTIVPPAEESSLSPALIRDKEIITPQSAIFQTSAEPDETPLGSHDVARVAQMTVGIDHPDEKTLPATGLPDKLITLKSDLVNPPEKLVVNQGDGIWQLCREVYGTVDTQIVAWVMEVNPHIQDPNELNVGDEVIFPRLTLASKNVASAATSANPES